MRKPFVVDFHFSPLPTPALAVATCDPDKEVCWLTTVRSYVPRFALGADGPVILKGWTKSTRERTLDRPEVQYARRDEERAYSVGKAQRLHRAVRATSITGLAVLIGACGTTFTAGRMADLKKPEDRAGVRYYLPIDVLQVSVKLTTPTTKKVKSEKEAGKWVAVSPENAQATPSDVSVDLLTIADIDNRYILDSKAVPLAKSDSTVTVSETGLLTGINATAQGSAGTVLQNVLKFAATYSSISEYLVNPAGASLQAVSERTNAPVSGITVDMAALTANRYQLNRALTGFELHSRKTPTDFSRTDFATCARVWDDDDFMDYYVSSDPGAKYGFQELPRAVAQRLRLDVCGGWSSVDAARSRLIEANRELATAKSERAIKSAAAKVKALRSEFTSYLAIANDAMTAIRSEVDVSLKSSGVGSAPKVETRTFVIGLDGLEPSTSISDLFDAVESNLTAKSNASGSSKAVLEQARLLLTVENVQGGTETNVGPSDAAKVCRPEATPTRAVPCVFYRLPRTLRVTAWSPRKTKKGASDGYAFGVVAARTIDAVKSDSVVQAIELENSIVTKRTVAIQFTPQGRLVSMKRESGSSAEAATQSLQEGLSGALTQYQSSLSSVKSIRDTQNSLDLLPYQQQLALANAQSALALQGPTAQLALSNAQSSLALQPVAAQLNDATTQLNLIKAQTALQAGQQTQLAELERMLIVAQQSLGTAQAQLATQQTTSADAQATAALTAELARLRQEVDVIKLRREVDELKKQ